VNPGNLNYEPFDLLPMDRVGEPSHPGTTRVVMVDADRAGSRLDIFLASRLAPAITRSQLVRMIRAGLVTINGTPARPASLVRTGDRVELSAPAPAQAPAVAQPVTAAQLEELFADDEIIVVNKPAGLAVHPAPNARQVTLVDLLVARHPELRTMVEPDGLVRPGIVHRLDKGTSGAMVVARTPFSRAVLSRQFKERTTGKVYLALAAGKLSAATQTIAFPIGRHPADRTRMSVRSTRLREAVTEVKVLECFKLAARNGASTYVSLLRVMPKTGRTHQIRVHLAAIGHPCLGDPVYGKARLPGSSLHFARQALHSLSLSFDHPRTSARVCFVAPLPDDFAHFLALHGVTVDQCLLERWVNVKEG
jgi:23S rRNA pseudouridine1911/1915/1917 synthase